VHIYGFGQPYKSVVVVHMQLISYSCQYVLHVQRDECTINPMLGVLYHSIFMLVCTYIMIQLVIGIVLDGIQMQSFMDEMVVGQVCTCAWVWVWVLRGGCDALPVGRLWVYKYERVRKSHLSYLCTGRWMFRRMCGHRCLCYWYGVYIEERLAFQKYSTDCPNPSSGIQMFDVQEIRVHMSMGAQTKQCAGNHRVKIMCRKSVHMSMGAQTKQCARFQGTHVNGCTDQTILPADSIHVFSALFVAAAV
jgi:hypothetical protein